MRINGLLLFTLLLAPACPSPAAEPAVQNTPAAATSTVPATGNTYKFTFVVRELVAGKVAGSRSYSALYSDEEHADPGAIRAGNKVATATGHGEYQYQDVGVNFDFRFPNAAEHVVPFGTNKILLHVSADISSVAPGDSGAAGPPPLLRQQRWNSNVLLDIGKPTLLFSSDDLVSDRTTQVELTAVKVQ
ncbi:hypothetical protein [Acidipila sp. EB88]|uniref:hypothetical protein n=1 Tax=Acidipila sp. EB88 TaxID=2305226 RepID=UPI000F5FAA2A|nr:hypothetical protein [Acidipila sp. EB88]RRA48038.1 hypothetical protein D1Y84_06785 [Acidipila sp. EB88]